MPGLTKVYPRPDISFIEEGLSPGNKKLYIAGAEGARDIEQLRELGIGTVVNCSVNLDINYVNDPKMLAKGAKCATGTAPFNVFKLGMIDGDGNTETMLLGGYYILHGAIRMQMPPKISYPNQETGNILVHCRGGRSRSVAISALYLHIELPQKYPTLQSAIDHIRIARELHPDEWFETPKATLSDKAQRAADCIHLLRTKQLVEA